MSSKVGTTSQAGEASIGSRASALSRADSTQVDLLRVICIFLMLSVHVYPHVPENTIIRGGEWNWIWYVYVDVLGRASVAVLSFVAGYILWIGARHRPLSKIARSRFQSLIIPMMTWNFIYAATVTVLALMEDRDVGTEMARYGVDNPLGAVSAITGLADRTINVPLTFLRDLFVSALAVRLFFPAMQKFGLLILAGLLIIALLDLGRPIFITPAIPLFVFAGAFLAAKGFSLKTMSDMKIALPSMIIFACLFVVSHLLPTMQWSLDQEAVNLSKRAMLVAAMLLVGRMLVDRTGPMDLSGVRPVLFLAFLTHSIVNQFLGVVWEILGFDVHSVSYVVFFFLNAPFDIIAAWAGMFLIERMPRRLQLVLHGSTESGKSAAIS